MFIEFEIIKLLLVIFSIFGYCFAFKKFFNQQLGFSLVFTISAISTLLFFSSVIFGNIYYLAKFFYFLGLASFLYILVKIFFYKPEDKYQINHDLALDTFLSPLFIFFTFISIYFYALYQGAHYMGWDEFSHWGVAAKELFIKNRLFEFLDLQKNLSSDLFYYYPPGSPLAQYFITKNVFIAEFSEEFSLIAHAILLTLPIFLPASSFLSKEKNLTHWLTNFSFYLIIFIFFKTYLVNVYFYILYVDVLLGLYFGALLSIILFHKKENKTDFIFFILALFFISFFVTIIKHSGFFLCILALPLIFFSLRTNQINFLQNKYYSAILQCLIILLAIFLAKSLWLNNAGVFHYSLPVKDNLDIFHLSQSQISIILNYLENWVKYFDTNRFVLIVFFTAIALFIILSNSFFFQRSEQKKSLFTILYLFALYLIYSFGLLVTYLYQMPEFDALKSASHERYLLTIISAICLVFFALILQDMPSGKFTKLFLGAIFLFFLFKLPQIMAINGFYENSFFKKDLNHSSSLSDKSINREFIKAETKLIDDLNLSKKDREAILILPHNFIYPECNYYNYELSPHYSRQSSLICEQMLQGIYVENIKKNREEKNFKLTNAENSKYFYPFKKEFIEINFIETAKKHKLLFIPRADKDLWQKIGKYFTGNNYQNYKFFSYDKKLDKFVIYQTTKNDGKNIR